MWRPGQRVATGDPLLSFDLDLVARRAKSLISPIVVIGDGFSVVPLALDRRVAAGEPIAEVRGARPEDGEAAGEVRTATVVIRAAHGLHARPAARIANRGQALRRRRFGSKRRARAPMRAARSH